MHDGHISNQFPHDTTIMNEELTSFALTQSAFTISKLTIETIEQDAKFVQS